MWRRLIYRRRLRRGPMDLIFGKPASDVADQSPRTN
ncbi:hypothetical protein BFJ72_g11178 [Fusarium proliferatum]|uniref:Uncharacterized protein n=1 Tax=Gibberella intermedia TaxID=948311 RepID=A0A420SPI9_GIBIN|nr:hypothetical protein BFJ72_g11178 [Fusarium proliferatum]